MIKTKWAASWKNQQNGMCAQRRLRSAWASAQSESAQSDQSLRCLHEEKLGYLSTYWADTENSDQTQVYMAKLLTDCLGLKQYLCFR